MMVQDYSVAVPCIANVNVGPFGYTINEVVQKTSQ